MSTRARVVLPLVFALVTASSAARAIDPPIPPPPPPPAPGAQAVADLVGGIVNDTRLGGVPQTTTLAEAYAGSTSRAPWLNRPAERLAASTFEGATGRTLVPNPVANAAPDFLGTGGAGGVELVGGSPLGGGMRLGVVAEHATAAKLGPGGTLGIDAAHLNEQQLRSALGELSPAQLQRTVVIDPAAGTVTRATDVAARFRTPIEPALGTPATTAATAREVQLGTRLAPTAAEARTLAELDAISAAGKNARPPAQFGGVVRGLGTALNVAIVADVAVNSYGRNTGNLLNGLLNPNDPALQEAVRSGQLRADDFVPGLAGNPFYDAYSWAYDRFNGVPQRAQENRPAPPPRSDWDDFKNGLKCLGTQGCVGRALGINFGSSWGDPHIITGDGLKYDFQSAGEFVMVEGDGVVVQVRQEPLRNSQTIAVNTAVAAKIGEHRVAVYVLPTARVLVDGQPASGVWRFADGGSVTVDGAQANLEWPAGDRLEVRLRGDHLDLAPALNDAQRGRTRGLYGNLDGERGNDLALRDGTILVQPVPFATMYGSYADSWRITQAESLFDYANGETTATFTRAGFPASKASTSSLTTEQRAAAEATCRAAGVTDPILLDACILDVGLTGDASFADGAVVARPPLESTTVDPRPVGTPTETFNGHVYAFVKGGRTYVDAEAFCRTNGMTLASISDAAENDFLSLAARSYAGGEWFTGGTDIATEGTFVWSDGTPFTFVAWHSGEPSNSGNEDCLTLNRFSPATSWNDATCSTARPFICEVTP